MKLKFFSGIVIVGMLVCMVPQMSYSQQRGTIVTLHPLVGEKLTRAERDRFGLFPEVEGFQWAVFRQMPDGSYHVTIAYLKDGAIHVRNRRLTREEYQHNYVEVVRRILEPEARFRKRGREVVIKTHSGALFAGKLMEMRNDSLFCYYDPLNFKPVRLAEVAEVTLVNRVNWKPVIYGILGATVILGAVGLASGDDPPGWFSMTATEKAEAGAIAGFSIGTVASIFYSMVKSVDVEVPISELSPELQRHYLQKIIERKYSTPKGIGASINGLALYTPEDGFRPGVEGRFSIFLKPRVSVDICYGELMQSSVHTIYRDLADNQYETSFEKTNTFYDWHYWGVSSRVQLAGFHRWMPFMGFGVYKFSKTTTENSHVTSILHNYPLPGQETREEYENKSKTTESWGNVRLSGGIKVQLFPHLYLKGTIEFSPFPPSYPGGKIGLQYSFL